MNPKQYKILIIIVLVSGIMSLTSCDKYTIFHDYQPISTDGWAATDTITFKIDSIPTDDIYHCALELRTTTSCPYKSLWIATEKHCSPNSTYTCDTLKFVLTDQHHHQKGTGIHLLQYSKNIGTIELHRGGNCIIRIYHLMNDECMSGVSDVGLRIEH